MNAADIVVVASVCKVAAFHKADGRQIWETVLVSGFFKFGETFVTLALDESGVYAHTKNELFRLDLLTGKVLWQQKVASLGRGVASMAVLGTANGTTTSAFAHLEAQRRAQNSGD